MTRTSTPLFNACYLIPLLLLLFTNLPLAAIYTWQDENGVQHFSDTPSHQQAEAVNLSHFPESTAQPTQSYQQPSSEAEPSAAELAPLTLAFSNLRDQQTIRDNQGNIQIQVGLNRPLAEDETLQLHLDGSPYRSPQPHTHWQLNHIDRGTHTLQVKAFKDGKVIASTITITVYLHRTSVLNRRKAQ